MFEPVLQSLRDVEGVQGAMMVDAGGAVIAARAHTIYDPPTLQRVARSIINTTDAVQLIQEDWDLLTSHFAEGKLLLRNLRVPGPRARRFVLAVIADARLNLAFLGVALRVAASKLIAAIEASPEATVAIGSEPVAAPSTNSGRIQLPQMPEAPAEPARTGLTWSGSNVSAASAVSNVAAVSEVTVADADASALLSSCTRALAASIGPIAKMLVKEAVREVCGARAFTRADAPALFGRLASQIPNAQARATFQRATTAL